MHPALVETTLVGYSETRPSRCLVAKPSSLDELVDVLRWCRDNGRTILSRAGGNSFGDMILNTGEVVVDLTGLNRIIAWDRSTGLMTVEPGVTFRQVFSRILVDGWTLSGCPGGMGVTIGGAIANDVHGKDSTHAGNFGGSVVSLKVLQADGTIVVLRAGDEMLRAVVGGMGLLGVIVEATLQMKAVPSAFVEAETVPVANIHESLRLLDRAQETHDFSVAWVDAFAEGPALGRGFVAMARWVREPLACTQQQVDASLRSPTKALGFIPAKPLWAVLRPLFMPGFVRYLNALNYHLNRLRHACFGPGRGVLLFTDYNFMTNKIPDLKHVYRPQGFLEFQCLIPVARGHDAVAGIFELCQRHGSQSLMCGMKRHAGDDCFLSFAGEGYSIGVDIQLRGRTRRQVDDFAREYFTRVTELGGKIYLAKDEMMTPAFFERQYPDVRTFLSIKRAMDPRELFQSDLYRRVLKPLAADERPA